MTRVENFLAERAQKQKRKRETREAELAGRAQGVAEESQQSQKKSRREHKVGEETQEELDDIHQETFLTNLEARRVENKNRKTYNNVPQGGLVIGKKRCGGRVSGRGRRVEVDEEFELPHNTEGYVDNCCPLKLTDE